MSKYQKWHDQIIERAKGRLLDDHFERHHIIPRSFGGSDCDFNLVSLTYREHFLIHWLLVKITSGIQKKKMTYALLCMGTKRHSKNRIISSWQYDIAKRAFADLKKDPSVKMSSLLDKHEKILNEIGKLGKESKAFHHLRGSIIENVLPTSASVKMLPKCYREETLNVLASDWLKHAVDPKTNRRPKIRMHGKRISSLKRKAAEIEILREEIEATA